MTKTLRASEHRNGSEHGDLRARVVPYYEDDAGIVLYHGDWQRFTGRMVMVDHVIMDPPYEAEAHTKGRRVKRSGVDVLDQWAWIDKKGTPRYETLPFSAITTKERFDVSQWVGQLVRRWVLVFSQAEAAHKWEHDLTEFGELTRRRWCVWVKPGAQPQFSGDRPGMGYETIVACHATGRSKWNGGGTVGVFTHAKPNTQGLLHPTTKPLPLMVELVTLFTDEGETILDPFAGSGTTGVAAKLNGRKAILIEKSEQYCEVAAKRLRATEPGRLFDKLPKAKPGAFSFSDAGATSLAIGSTESA